MYVCMYVHVCITYSAIIVVYYIQVVVEKKMKGGVQATIQQLRSYRRRNSLHTSQQNTKLSS